MIPQDFSSCHNSSVPALAWLLLVRDGGGFPNRRSKFLGELSLILKDLFLTPRTFSQLYVRVRRIQIVT